MLSLDPIMNMPEVTLTFKCGVITSDGQIDPDGYKFLTWSYVAGNSNTSEASFSHISLAQRVLSVYPQLVDEPSRLVYIDEDKDRIAIPCDNIKETLAALKAIFKGQLDEQQTNGPIRIFIHLTSQRSSNSPVADTCSGKIHSITCSSCNKSPVSGFVYHCLECSDNLDLCGHCGAAGKHPEHVLLRFSGDMPTCLPQMKQLMAKYGNQQNSSGISSRKIKLKTCTLRAL